MAQLTEVQIQVKMKNFWMDCFMDLVKRAIAPEQQSKVITFISGQGAALERELRSGR